MTTKHRLIGYDPKTDLEKFSVEVPEQMLPFLTKLIPFEKDDPQAFDSYELDYPVANDIAGALLNYPRATKEIAGFQIKRELPSDLKYFLECFALD